MKTRVPIEANSSAGLQSETPCWALLSCQGFSQILQPVSWNVFCPKWRLHSETQCKSFTCRRTKTKPVWHGRKHPRMTPSSHDCDSSSTLHHVRRGLHTLKVALSGRSSWPQIKSILTKTQHDMNTREKRVNPHQLLGTVCPFMWMFVQDYHL